jgi:hypothetical protein
VRGWPHAATVKPREPDERVTRKCNADSPVITHFYDPTTCDLLGTDQPDGCIVRDGYDGYRPP